MGTREAHGLLELLIGTLQSHTGGKEILHDILGELNRRGVGGTEDDVDTAEVAVVLDEPQALDGLLVDGSRHGPAAVNTIHCRGTVVHAERKQA